MAADLRRPTQIVVVGGGLGGVAAALAAARLGAQVTLLAEGDWVGGQLTAQGVPADEHAWIESHGASASYRRLREGIRRRTRQAPGATEAARSDPALNPGRGRVSKISCEPLVAASVLDEMLADAVISGRLTVWRRAVVDQVAVDRDRVVSARVQCDGRQAHIECDYLIDATEEGDLLPLAGCEHVLGAESQEQTGEPHALVGDPDPWEHQAITWCMALERLPGPSQPIDRPAGYERWRSYQPPEWPNRMLDWTYPNPRDLRPIARPLYGDEGDWTLWAYRRIRFAGHFEHRVNELSALNWPQNDYFVAPVTGVAEPERSQRLAEARELTLSLLYWLQTEAERPDGGHGYPEIVPASGAFGAPDGLAPAPYIRESRRIEAEFTVREQHVGVQARPGRNSAEQFADSVGIGYYALDLHPSTTGRSYVDLPNYPFQIPLGALLPVRLDNLLPASKNIGTTHITNGCYRLHPVEWAIGEAAGALAAFCLAHRTTPRHVRSSQRLLADFQRTLTGSLGVELEWPVEIRER